MLTTANMRKQYDKIQKQLFYMIPEKWDRVYLYASVVDHFNGLQTGEMFFYYFPKSIMKRNPVNVYEVPNKFNVNEQSYLSLAEKLYDEIKTLRSEMITEGEKPWSNVTMYIENFKFYAEYYYDNLQDSRYTSYDRHLIWRHLYLQIPLTSYSKKERNMIEEYLARKEHNHKHTYQEGIYQKPINNVIEYNKQESREQIVEEKQEHTELKQLINQTEQSKQELEEQTKTITSQILNGTKS